MRLKTVAVILNPTSGGGAGRRQRALIESGLAERGVSASIFETSARGDATNLARDLAESGTSVVVAAGGDGTVHEVANGLLRARVEEPPTMGVIPVGTGNDFVKVVPGARTFEQALDTVARGNVRNFDVGRVRWHEQDEYFVNGMGTGIDVEVVRQLGRVPQLPGPLKYLISLVRALVYYKPVHLRALVDEQQLEQSVMIVAVGNGICQGGGFYLAPEASPSDGKLDVCVVDRLSLPGIARVLTRVMRGTQKGDPAVLMRTARSIRFEAADDRPLFFHLDGELREPPGLRSLQIEIIPAALPVLTADA